MDDPKKGIFAMRFREHSFQLSPGGSLFVCKGGGTEAAGANADNDLQQVIKEEK